MHIVNVAAFACAVISASAFEFPDFVPLHKRQEPGTAAYDCHADCGGVILAGRSDGYCDAADFKSQLTDCLNCAVEFEIWKYYGDSVSKAATGCGLDATPVDSSSTSVETSSATTSVGATTTKSAHEGSHNSAVTTEVATTSTGTLAHTTIASTSVSPHHVSGSSHPASLIPSATPTGSSTASTPSSSPLYSGGASINTGSGLVSGALVGCVIAAFL